MATVSPALMSRATSAVFPQSARRDTEAGQRDAAPCVDDLRVFARDANGPCLGSLGQAARVSHAALVMIEGGGSAQGIDECLSALIGACGVPWEYGAIGLPDGSERTQQFLAGWTGLEPAASGVTGRRYNQA
jgi:hypothetical protein